MGVAQEFPNRDEGAGNGDQVNVSIEWTALQNDRSLGRVRTAKARQRKVMHSNVLSRQCKAPSEIPSGKGVSCQVAYAQLNCL